MSNDAVRPSTTVTLFVCVSCGLPVEVPASEASKFPIWEARLGQELVVEHIVCPAPPVSNQASS